MAIKPTEIPIIEDIYDFDTITLREVTEKVQITLKKIESLDQKDQSQILWLKKARRYLELALQEIEERKAVENFGNFCVSNNDSILMSNMEDTSGGSDSHSSQNKQSQQQQQQQQQKNQNQQNSSSNGQSAFGNVDDWIKLHQQLSQQQDTHHHQSAQEKKSASHFHQKQQYSVPHQIKESEQEDDENYQSTHIKNNKKNINENKYTSSSQKKQKHYQDEDGDADEDEEEEDNLLSASVMKREQKLSGNKTISQGSTDFCNSSMVSGKSLSSSASSQAKYLAHQKRIKNKSKQDEMQDFIRQTLEKTRITTNTNVGGSQGMSSYNFHKTSSLGEESSDGTEIAISRKKKKASSSASVTSTQLPKRQSVPLPEKQEVSSEYSGVQSRIKQELEQQRLKKLDTPYFTTGKASYPKYKPPTVKKVDPEDEKKGRVKNFLKKSKPSIVLPPIVQKTTTATVKSSSADNSTSAQSRSNKNNNHNIASRTSITSNSTDNLTEKIHFNTADISHSMGDDSYLHNQKLNASQSRIADQSQQFNQIGNNNTAPHLNGEIIQEEIYENNNESDFEKEKIIPGQPRKITKGELFRIKSTHSTIRSATSEKSSTSQQGETPNKFDFSSNPQEFIDEDIYNDEETLRNQVIKEKLMKTKSRSSLQSIKNTINIEDQSQKQDQNIESSSSSSQQKEFLKIRDTAVQLNQLQIEDQSQSSKSINVYNRSTPSPIPSIIAPEMNGIVSIKTILNQEQDNTENKTHYGLNENENIVQRRVEDENPSDSEDDLNEDERLLLYNKTSEVRNSVDGSKGYSHGENNEQSRKQSDSNDDELDEEERELIQGMKNAQNQANKDRVSSNHKIEEESQSRKQSVSKQNLSKQATFKKEGKNDEENNQEEDYQGEDQLDEDESQLLKEVNKATLELQISRNEFINNDNEFLIEKYEKDSNEIVMNAKKILENKGINDQLRNRMEKLLNNFQQNSLEVEKIEQKVKENQEQHKKHQEEVKKNKNQIFGRPSSASKRNSEQNGISNTTVGKQVKNENEDEQKGASANVKDKNGKKAVTLDDKKDASKQRNKEDRAGSDITNSSTNNNKFIPVKGKIFGKDKPIQTKELSQLQSLQQEQETFIKEQQQIMKKKALAAAPPKPPSMTSKLLMKMMKEINDETLLDYTSQISSFFHLFSGYYNTAWSQNNPMMGGNVGSSINMNLTGGSGGFCLIDQMRDMYQLFQQHVEKVDNADKGLLRYKQVVTPLDVLPSEVYYINDPQKVIVYQNRVDIDMRKFIERQIIFTQRMNGENFAGHLLPHEEFYYRVVKSKPEVYDIISRSFMRKTDWFELPHGLQLRTSWNLLWTWSKPQIDFNKLLFFQKVNHFPFNKNLVRKDLLKKNFERVTKLGQKAAHAFNILPLTFVLPKEYCNFSERFYEEMLREGENNIWIMKPVGKSQGRGISLVNDIAQVVYAEPVVVQKYMKDPLLLDGYKFDMRIYALITHMKPLEAFVYKEGFARLSTEKYTLNAQTIKNNQIHLTNFSIQKHHYDPASNNNFIGGTKISLKMLQEKFKQRGIDWDKIWIQVQEIIVKSVLACQADIPNNPNCFEIFGYDIIIDSSLKCILLEINSSPSLARDFIIDDLIKQQMIDDAIDLVSPVQFDRLRLLEVLDRRIREEQGNKSNINTTNNSKLQLNRDLNYILRGQKLRQFGEAPAYLGQWQKVAPTEMSDKYLKIIQSYKLPSVRQNTATAANNNNTID